MTIFESFKKTIKETGLYNSLIFLVGIIGLLFFAVQNYAYPFPVLSKGYNIYTWVHPGVLLIVLSTILRIALPENIKQAPEQYRSFIRITSLLILLLWAYYIPFIFYHFFFNRKISSSFITPQLLSFFNFAFLIFSAQLLSQQMYINNSALIESVERDNAKKKKSLFYHNLLSLGYILLAALNLIQSFFADVPTSILLALGICILVCLGLTVFLSRVLTFQSGFKRVRISMLVLLFSFALTALVEK